MKKKRISARIGNKLLTLDNEDSVDEKFKQEFKAVAQTNPQNLQEFLERLADVQSSNSLKKKARVLDEKSKTVQNEGRKKI